MEYNAKILEAEFSVQGKTFTYFSLKNLEKYGHRISSIPYSIRILIESAIRNIDGKKVTQEHVKCLLAYNKNKRKEGEISFVPTRVLLQDFTGVPCVVDLASMRSTMRRLAGDPAVINPCIPVDLVIDHSIQVDVFNRADAFERNSKLEFKRNKERYEFLRWGQKALKNFRVIPPASGICHQVNLEYLARVVQIDDRGRVFFDTVIGTDSHTTMINGLGVLGWGVGGIEAEAAMLGYPLYMLAPEVIGFELHGSLKEGVTATDLVLTITQMLRNEGVVGKFVEFFGAGLKHMSIPDRATISNMAPEYGATMGYFPIDMNVLDYLMQTGRDQDQIAVVETYAKLQGMFYDETLPTPDYTKCLELDLNSVEPSIAGPRRPQDRIPLSKSRESWEEIIQKPVQDGGYGKTGAALQTAISVGYPDSDRQMYKLHHGDVVIAAITSCTNTSNPSVLLAAGLLAKKAREKGLNRKPWVKTSFAPGSMVVTDYLHKSGLMSSLEELGFYLVGYGCTTCIGNSGPLDQNIIEAINKGDIVAVSVLSGNRNFEGRINPNVRANFLMSPPLVVLYALTGNITFDFARDALGSDAQGNKVYLKDIWPSQAEIKELQARTLRRESFQKRYAGIEQSNMLWNNIHVEESDLYTWNKDSSYIQDPPFFEGMSVSVDKITAIKDAHVLVWAGDSVTTDHISPAGAISPDSPAGEYLQKLGISREFFNSYGSRRGNDRIMTRGTFANIRFRNLLIPEAEGSVTIHFPTGEQLSIYAAAMLYKRESIPTIVCAGKDYGMGSSRDWAAKGVMLLGVRAVLVESIERIHRSNLIGMGVLPLQFQKGENLQSLGLTGGEKFTIHIDDTLRARDQVKVSALSKDGKKTEFSLLCRIDSPVEIDYYRNGGILQTVLRSFLKS